jgi:hypothetical protein
MTLGLEDHNHIELTLENLLALQVAGALLLNTDSPKPTETDRCASEVASGTTHDTGIVFPSDNLICMHCQPESQPDALL